MLVILLEYLITLHFLEDLVTISIYFIGDY